MLLNALIVLVGVVVAVAVALLCESARLNKAERKTLACDIERDAVRSSLLRVDGRVVVPFRATSSPTRTPPGARRTAEQSEGATADVASLLRPSLVRRHGQSDLLGINAKTPTALHGRRP